MIDKVQKIREEVVRLKSQLLRGACSSQITMETSCKEEAYDEVLTLLDTMQKEPESEDLDDQRFAKEMDAVFALPSSETKNTKEEPLNWEYAIAKHFFKLGLRAQQEPVSEDLEEAAIAFSKHFGEWDYAIPCFKEGAIWQKQQLMANAIDVEMKVDAGGYPYIDITIELYDYDKDIPLAKEGDKYSVILIKEG